MTQARPPYDCNRALGERIVSERLARGERAIGWIVCPSPLILLTPIPLRHVHCCALLRTAQGAVWMIRTFGHAWTERRLALAARALADLGEPSVRDPKVAKYLAAILGLPALTVLHAALNRVDPAQWEIRRLAEALLARVHADRRSTPGVDAEFVGAGAIERRIKAELESAMRRFVDRLDGRVLAAAPRSLEDIDVYNYLARQPQQRNRLQLVSTFPLFVPAAATAGHNPVGAPIRMAVDAALPLIKTLSKQWFVSPSAVRCLLHRPADVVGRRWESNPRSLVAALNALPADLRPGPEPEAWARFNTFIAHAESVFGHRLLESSLGLAWLRHAARGGWSRAVLDGAGVADDAQHLEAIETLRQALLGALRAQNAVALTHAAEADTEARLVAIVDGHLASLSPRRLVEMARGYQHELERGRAQLEDDFAYLSGEQFWPLLPEDYVSCDGSRRVRGLTTLKSLMRHGLAMNNCLAGESFANYAARCRKGTTYLLGIFDAHSGVPLSTAEVTVTTPHGCFPLFRLVQHTGFHNAEPTTACQVAVAEVMELLSTPKIKEHFVAGVRARQRREAWIGRPCDGALDDSLLCRGRKEAERSIAMQAVRRAIGDKRFDELVKLTRAVGAAFA